MPIPGGREKCYKALYDRLVSKLTMLKHHTRRLEAFDKIPAEQQPALFFEAVGYDPISDPNLPIRWNLVALATILVRGTKDPTQNTDVQINAIIDQVEEALTFQPGEDPPQMNGEYWMTTLGGIVRRCYIFDTIVIEHGYSSNQAHVSIPIAMETIATSRKRV